MRVYLVRAILLLSFLLGISHKLLANGAALLDTFTPVDEVINSVASLKEREKKYFQQEEDHMHAHVPIFVTSCFSHSKCTGFGDGGYVVPPYPLAEADWILRDRPSSGDAGGMYAWVPVHDVPAANRKIAEWRDRIKSQRLSDCRDGACVLIAMVKPKDSDEPVLGSCLVPKIGMFLGAPVVCTSLLKRENQNDYIRVAVGTGSIRNSIGRPDFNFSVRLASSAGVKMIASAISGAMQASPLMLQTKIKPTSIIGVAPFRPSFVLAPLFDVFTVRVDFDAHQYNDKVWIFEAIVSTTLYVSQRNSNRVADWHLPSDAETNEYARLIDNNIRTEINKRCHRFQSVDDFTMNCDVEGDIGLETAHHDYEDFGSSADRNQW